MKPACPHQPRQCRLQTGHRMPRRCHGPAGMPLSLQSLFWKIQLFFVKILFRLACGVFIVIVNWNNTHLETFSVLMANMANIDRYRPRASQLPGPWTCVAVCRVLRQEGCPITGGRRLTLPGPAGALLLPRASPNTFLGGPRCWGPTQRPPLTEPLLELAALSCLYLFLT